jgi:hypothetical protein
MIRTGEQYKDSIRDGREVYVRGERVTGDETTGEMWSMHGGQDVLIFLESKKGPGNVN